VFKQLKWRKRRKKGLTGEIWANTWFLWCRGQLKRFKGEQQSEIAGGSDVVALNPSLGGKTT